MIYQLGALVRLNEAGLLKMLDRVSSVSCPPDRTAELAATPTRLKRLEAGRQERLMNWGYAVRNAALRKHVDDANAAPGGFPFRVGV